MYHISLFSGIGGFDLAAEEMCWENIVSCEIDDMCNRVLEYYWPNAYHHKDIKTLTYKIIDEELSKRKGDNWRTKDIIITGGFPCQPYSTAGKRLGKEDERHLWPEMLRAIREIQPRWVVGENVRGIINWNGGMVFEEVQADLEAEGYEVQPFVLPAASVNAPHERYRTWFVAYSKYNGDIKNAEDERIVKNTNKDGRRSIKRKKEPNKREQWYFSTGDNEPIPASGGKIGVNPNTKQQGLQRKDRFRLGKAEQSSKHSFTPSGGSEGHIDGPWEKFPTQSPICNRNDGISDRLVNITFPRWRKEAIKMLGNSVVPQVVIQIFKAIESYENL